MKKYNLEHGWLDLPVFGDKPYTQREAWSWIIGESNKLEKYQLFTSINFMALKFQWDKKDVLDFIKKLERYEMIIFREMRMDKILIIPVFLGVNHG